jgi:vitamin B12 transporter
MRGLVATGFKAPSLYQLFAPSNAYFDGGNRDLKPEKSISYEYGLDQYLFGDKITASITYFHTLYTDIIDALTNPNTWVTGQYINIGKTQVHGIEASVEIRPADHLKLTAGLTYQKTKDFQNDQEMIRRPERKFFVEVLWKITERLSLNANVRYNGPMSDNLSNPAWSLNTYKVKEFTVAGGVVNYEINKNLSAYVKIDNLFNKHYEEARGYGTAPFSMYGGVKARF